MKGENDGSLTFAGRVAVAVGIGAAVVLLLYFLQHLAEALLLVFAGLLLGVALDGTARWLEGLLPLRRGLSLLIILAVGLIVLFAGTWLAGPRIADQAARLMERVPAALENMRSSLADIELGRVALERAPSLEEFLAPRSGLMGRITGLFSSAVGVVFGIVVVIFVGLFTAASPNTYVRGAVHIVPRSRRERVRQVIGFMGRALRWWLVGRLASMLVVGLLTVVGLLIVGLPLALILGLVAGLLSFVPLVGPVVAAIPAILVGFVQGPLQALYVVVVYTVVQTLESNLITPIIQKQAVSLPPALLIVGQLLMGVLFGWFGVLLATPLVVVAIVAGQSLYVEDVLGDDVRLLGLHGSG